MKRLLYCLLAASLMFSCKPKTLLEEYKPIIQGVWVKKEYLDEVVKTKSPAAVPQNFNDIIVMNVDTKMIKGDSLTIYVGKANHALSYVKMYFQPGKTPGSVKIADSEADYTINGRDTILNIHYEVQGKRMVMPYIKVAHTGNSEKIGVGLDRKLNEYLIAGKYDLKDSGGLTKEVDFTVDGKLTGLGSFKTYYINNDFIKGMNNVDGLTFDMANPKKTSGLAFKIKDDTLDLYNTRFDTTAQKTMLTNIKYHLVRKK